MHSKLNVFKLGLVFLALVFNSQAQAFHPGNMTQVSTNVCSKSICMQMRSDLVSISHLSSLMALENNVHVDIYDRNHKRINKFAAKFINYDSKNQEISIYGAKVNGTERDIFFDLKKDKFQVF